MALTEQPTFYDQHPFDWIVAGADTDIRSVVSPALADLIEGLEANSLVLDVGCGPGRVLGFLARRELRCIGIDRSYVSISRAVGRYGRPGVVADNLSLTPSYPMASYTTPRILGRHFWRTCES
jgi:SAM-dependent methyltransferase